MFQPNVKLTKAGPQSDSSQAKAVRAGPVTGTQQARVFTLMGAFNSNECS